MTAASAFPPETSDGRPAEPSMEDILASIRRIIADDQTHGAKPTVSNGARRPMAPEQERAVARARTPYDDVLDLARMVPAAPRMADELVEPEAIHPEPPRTAAAPNDLAPVETAAIDAEDHPESLGPASSSSLRARMPDPVTREVDVEHETFDHPVPALSGDPEGDLMSAPLGESVMSAFETLAATVVLQNTPMLERMMRDLLRPMLKDWLDDNLPSLVERLVRAEIERVARGTRG